MSSTAEPATRGNPDRRWFIVLAAFTALLVAGLVILLVEELGGGHNGPKPAAITPVPVGVVQAVTHVPAVTSAAVGRGEITVAGLPRSTGGPALSTSPKPEVLFIGAEYCPYCAAQRWAIVQALSRFGTFTNLGQIRSQEYHVATFDFRHTSFASPYLTFSGREVADQTAHRLERLTKPQLQQWETYLSPGETGPSFPFLDIDGRYVSLEAMVDVNQLLGRSATQIAAALGDPSTPLAKTVLGSANEITAAVCRVTAEQPAAVCTPAIQSLASAFTAYRH